MSERIKQALIDGKHTSPDGTYVQISMDALMSIIGAPSSPTPEYQDNPVCPNCDHSLSCGWCGVEIPDGVVRRAALDLAEAVTPHLPEAWQCTDALRPYLLGHITQNRDTIKAWESGGIEYVALVPASRSRFAASTVEPAPGSQDERLVRITDYWRNDAFENAAQIVERYGVDPQIASDIRALKKGSAK